MHHTPPFSVLSPLSRSYTGGEVTDMKDRFNRFAIRLVTVMLLGVLLLLLHTWRTVPVLAFLVPQSRAPWELGKIAYFPLLGMILLTGRLTGGTRTTAEQLLPCLVLLPAAVTLSLWLLSPLHLGAGALLLLWIVWMAAGLAAGDRMAPHGKAWLAAAVLWGALYILFTCLPPVVGPFLDPADVLTMRPVPLC